MNRVRLGIAVLLALVLLSSASAWLVRSETSRLLNDLDQLRETVLQSPEQAEQAFQQFHDQWESRTPPQSGGVAGQGGADRRDRCPSDPNAGRRL